MSGANYDILAQGLIDKQLTGNPTTTFWRSQWKKHTRFSIESISQPFNTATTFGQESQVMLNRVGDMVYFLYLHVVLPGIVACDAQQTNCMVGNSFPVYMDENAACNPCQKMDEAALAKLGFLESGFEALSDDDKAEALIAAKNKWRKQSYKAAPELECCVDGGDSDCPSQMGFGDNWAHYCNDIGHFMINKAKLVIGGSKVDELWGTFLFCWEELTGKSGRRLTELTGRRYTRAQLCCDAREERHLYIPLPFYFTLASGSALPLASLAYHGVQISVEFEQLQKLVVVSNSDVVVTNASTGAPITPNDLRADVEVTYCFLDSMERDRFASSQFEQLIVQTQHYFKTESKEICRIPLSFNHPTLEIIFGVRRQCQERCNNLSNLSGVDGRDPIIDAELLLNTTSRFGKKPALFWRGVVPYQHHSNLPEAYIYVMSFALNPESSLEPSGSCNLSRIDNTELVLTMQTALTNESYTVFVFARSWNLMRYKEGLAGAAFQ